MQKAVNKADTEEHMGKRSKFLCAPSVLCAEELLLVFRLLDCEDLIRGDIAERLANSARPTYFDFTDAPIRPESKMHPTVAR